MDCGKIPPPLAAFCSRAFADRLNLVRGNGCADEHLGVGPWRAGGRGGGVEVAERHPGAGRAARLGGAQRRASATARGIRGGDPAAARGWAWRGSRRVAEAKVCPREGETGAAMKRPPRYRMAGRPGALAWASQRASVSLCAATGCRTETCRRHPIQLYQEPRCGPFAWPKGGVVPMSFSPPRAPTAHQMENRVKDRAFQMLFPSPRLARPGNEWIEDRPFRIVQIARILALSS